jgi:hypothetical protein
LQPRLVLARDEHVDDIVVDKVIEALSGRELPYRNVWAELAEEYDLNGSGMSADDVMD